MNTDTQRLKALSVARSTAVLFAAQLQTLMDLYADNPSAQDAVRRWWAQTDLTAELLAKREAELEAALQPQREADLRAQVDATNRAFWDEQQRQHAEVVRKAYWQQRTEEQAP